MSETQNLLTEAEAANYLNLSRSQMKKLRARPHLPQPTFVRYGRTIRYPINGPNGLAAFVASHTVSRKA